MVSYSYRKLDIIRRDTLDAVVQRFSSAWHTETHSLSRCRLLAMKQNLNYNNVLVLADRANGRTYATVLRPSVVCDVTCCG